ncbi:collagen alpha-1(VII) chain-like [Vanessa cardui]|uniref:collagen alpha-1(VII) chain-like n=1 Tax=Vanessa cardui TaxID=171605 RepID=UPI001F138F1F|nr:collagen alpha-1(VII) chain-like [Vanessa cardui]
MLLVLFLCFKHTLACRSHTEIEAINNTKTKNFFGNSSTWGGWDPPEDDSSWKNWVNLWSSKNFTNDSSVMGQESESGWPQYWGNLEKNGGLPLPPWAILPLAYGKPQFCFLQPDRGECDKNLKRWGYNPTTNDCQMFEYSGCGGNDNNFRDKETCKKSCIDNSSTGCESQAKINFEEMIYD